MDVSSRKASLCRARNAVSVNLLMNSALSSSAQTDLQGLIDAFAQAVGDDGLRDPFSPAQWSALAPYLQPCSLAAGQVLFSRGASERTLYLIESGSLSVHYEDEKERLRLAIVASGSVVGEGAFVSHRPRTASVQAAAASKLWALTPLRFTELSNRQPALALGLSMAAGSVLARRLSNRRRRVAAT